MCSCIQCCQKRIEVGYIDDGHHQSRVIRAERERHTFVQHEEDAHKYVGMGQQSILQEDENPSSVQCRAKLTVMSVLIATALINR